MFGAYENFPVAICGNEFQRGLSYLVHKPPQLHADRKTDCDEGGQH